MDALLKPRPIVTPQLIVVNGQPEAVADVNNLKPMNMKKTLILSCILAFTTQCEEPSRISKRIKQAEYFTAERNKWPIGTKGYADNARKLDSVISLTKVEDSLETIKNRRIIDSAEKAKNN